MWATDAGVAATPATLRKIATITNANLTFTRGLVWIEDVHYNADKGPAGFAVTADHTRSCGIMWRSTARSPTATSATTPWTLVWSIRP